MRRSIPTRMVISGHSPALFKTRKRRYRSTRRTKDLDIAVLSPPRLKTGRQSSKRLYIAASILPSHRSDPQCNLRRWEENSARSETTLSVQSYSTEKAFDIQKVPRKREANSPHPILRFSPHPRVTTSIRFEKLNRHGRNNFRSVFIQDALYETFGEAYSGGSSSKQRDPAILLLHRSLSQTAKEAAYIDSDGE